MYTLSLYTIPGRECIFIHLPYTEIIFSPSIYQFFVENWFIQSPSFIHISLMNNMNPLEPKDMNPLEPI